MPLLVATCQVKVNSEDIPKFINELNTYEKDDNLRSRTIEILKNLDLKSEMDGYLFVNKICQVATEEVNVGIKLLQSKYPYSFVHKNQI